MLSDRVSVLKEERLGGALLTANGQIYFSEVPLVPMHFSL